MSTELFKSPIGVGIDKGAKFIEVPNFGVMGYPVIFSRFERTSGAHCFIFEQGLRSYFQYLQQNLVIRQGLRRIARLAFDAATSITWTFWNCQPKMSTFLSNYCYLITNQSM